MLHDVRPPASAASAEPPFRSPDIVRAPGPAVAGIDREASWVEFDRRVLELAGAPQLPLVQRIRLCGIVSSNLDEFFAVRVARLLNRRAEGDQGAATAARSLAAIRRRVLRLQADQDDLWHESLIPELAGHGVHIQGLADTGRRVRDTSEAFARRRLLATVDPVEVTPGAPFPRLRALTLAIVAESRSPVPGRGRVFVVALPASVPRFIPLDISGRRILVGIEDLVGHHLEAVLGVTPIRRAVVRLTRDALLPDVLDAHQAKAESEIHERREVRNAVVRLEVSAASAEPLASDLAERLGLREDQVYWSSAPLGLAALRDTSMLAVATSPRAGHEAAPPAPDDVFARLALGDVLAHHPYDSFETSVDAFTAAARDPGVTTLQATVYRTGDPSSTLSELMQAAQDGRRSVCVMELRARFDEAPNICWTRTLRRGGVEVLHGPPDMKVHAKLALVERREGRATTRYVHIGTGNYHASNASVYEDVSLFTADPAIGADARALFDLLAEGGGIPRFEKLVVGPWHLKPWLLNEIAVVARGARAGHPSRIGIKVNAVADPEIVAALYAASTAGVEIDVVARGICTLRPGVPGLSDRIRIRSVLGPFLEHSRIFSFETGDHRRLMIGSADLLTRNLERRIEVLAPVEDAPLRARIDGIMDALLADTLYAWELAGDGRWSRVRPAPDSAPVSAHDVLLLRAEAAAGPRAMGPGRSGRAVRARSRREVEQRRHDAPVHVAAVREPELREDGVDVSLDAALRDARCHRDRRVAASLGEQAEDLQLARRQHVDRMSRPGCQELRDDL
jgi:polyphosphate kinase